METKLMKKHIAFALLVVSLSIGGHITAANEANRVEVDGDRLSVRAEGMALGNLLMAVEQATGVQFVFDGLAAERKVFLDFERLPLSEAMRKIIHPLNFAAIYDDTDRLRKVVILGRGKDSGARERREAEDGSSKSSRSGSLHTAPSTPRGGSDTSTTSKVQPLRRGPLQFHDPAADKKKAKDGPPVRQEQGMGGPPLNKSYSVDGPPKTQSEESPGPPDGGSSDNPPPPDPDDSPPDGPPQDWKYEVNGPPGWQHM
jgi:hypothetical protein